MVLAVTELMDSRGVLQGEESYSNTHVHVRLSSPLFAPKPFLLTVTQTLFLCGKEVCHTVSSFAVLSDICPFIAYPKGKGSH